MSVTTSEPTRALIRAIEVMTLDRLPRDTVVKAKDLIGGQHYLDRRAQRGDGQRNGRVESESGYHEKCSAGSERCHCRN